MKLSTLEHMLERAGEIENASLRGWFVRQLALEVYRMGRRAERAKNTPAVTVSLAPLPSEADIAERLRAYDVRDTIHGMTPGPASPDVTVETNLTREEVARQQASTLGPNGFYLLSEEEQAAWERGEWKAWPEGAVGLAFRRPIFLSKPPAAAPPPIPLRWVPIDAAPGGCDPECFEAWRARGEDEATRDHCVVGCSRRREWEAAGCPRGEVGK